MLCCFNFDSYTCIAICRDHGPTKQREFSFHDALLQKRNTRWLDMCPKFDWNQLILTNFLRQRFNWRTSRTTKFSRNPPLFKLSYCLTNLFTATLSVANNKQRTVTARDWKGSGWGIISCTPIRHLPGGTAENYEISRACNYSFTGSYSLIHSFIFSLFSDIFSSSDYSITR